jgi:iduronate 2-sulfatase
MKPISNLMSLRLRIGLALPLVAASLLSATAGQKLNVLFFAVDDLRPQLGCYGVTDIRTPNIDKLASDGLLFNRAYCQQAVCSPSRTSLLTGRRPDTTKVYDLVKHFRDVLPDVVTLPQHFKNNGYFCQSFGKIFHGGLDDPKSWSAP